MLSRVWKTIDGGLHIQSRRCPKVQEVESLVLGDKNGSGFDLSWRKIWQFTTLYFTQFAKLFWLAVEVSFLEFTRVKGSVHIIESVDSICRDSADTQYMLIRTNFSKSPKQLTYKPL